MNGGPREANDERRLAAQGVGVWEGLTMAPKDGFRFLSLVRPFMSVLPEVVQPDRRVPFRCVHNGAARAGCTLAVCVGLKPPWRPRVPGSPAAPPRGSTHA